MIIIDDEINYLHMLRSPPVLLLTYRQRIWDLFDSGREMNRNNNDWDYFDDLRE